MRYFIGIDPGVSGAAAMISEDLSEHLVSLFHVERSGRHNMLVISSLPEILGPMLDHKCADVHVAIEKAATLGQAGKAPNFVYGYAAGAVEAYLVASGAPFILVSPKDWKSVILRGAGKGRKAQKDASLRLVRNLFPGSAIKNHNIADAICIALFARHFWTGRDV